MENTKQIESFSAEDTHALGKKLGENAKPGDVYTLLGDLGVGKTVPHTGIADGLGIKEAICTLHLRLYKYMTREGCRFIILMYTESAI